VAVVVPLLGEYPSTLSNRYHLLEVIGSGGTGVVWRAYDQTLHRQVACKVLSGSFAHNPVFQKRFQREAHHVASLSHPNIVMVFDSGTESDLSFIVMEHVQGASLRQVLHSYGVLPVGVTAALAVDVLAALGHAHDRGIVHRDVKPANLLLESGAGVKVTDFGIAKSLNEMTELTAEGGFVGTSTYASPEQLFGRTLGASSDFYSLGCVLFECLAGRPPEVAESGGGTLAFQRLYADPPSIASLRPETPDEIAGAITRALAKDPSGRFTSAAEMREVFLPFAMEEQLRQLLSRGNFGVQTDETALGRSDATPVRDDGFGSRQSSVLVGTPLVSVRAIGAKRRSRGRNFKVALIAMILIVVAIATLIATRAGEGPKISRISAIPSGGFLRPGHSITSPDGRFTLKMQLDGNLVDYRQRGTVALWQSGTSGSFNAYVVMQADGNLVVYPHGKTAPDPGQPTSALFDSGTFGHPEAIAALLNSGVLEVRASGTDTVLWRSQLRSSAS
jgi:hypothetical protein